MIPLGGPTKFCSLKSGNSLVLVLAGTQTFQHFCNMVCADFS